MGVGRKLPPGRGEPRWSRVAATPAPLKDQPLLPAEAFMKQDGLNCDL